LPVHAAGIGSSAANPPQKNRGLRFSPSRSGLRTILVRLVALTSKSNPFWFESTRKSWQSATQSSVKRLFQGDDASFRSLGLVFAVSSHQLFIHAPKEVLNDHQ
jgi:hypothetical protein